MYSHNIFEDAILRPNSLYYAVSVYIIRNRANEHYFPTNNNRIVICVMWLKLEFKHLIEMLKKNNILKKKNLKYNLEVSFF